MIAALDEFSCKSLHIPLPQRNKLCVEDACAKPDGGAELEMGRDATSIQLSTQGLQKAATLSLQPKCLITALDDSTQVQLPGSYPAGGLVPPSIYAAGHALVGTEGGSVWGTAERWVETTTSCSSPKMHPISAQGIAAGNLSRPAQSEHADDRLSQQCLFEKPVPLSSQPSLTTSLREQGPAYLDWRQAQPLSKLPPTSGLPSQEVALHNLERARRELDHQKEHPELSTPCQASQILSSHMKLSLADLGSQQEQQVMSQSRAGDLSSDSFQMQLTGNEW